MAGYTRTDTTNNIADGNIINATDLDNEFDGIQAAFNSSTGHNHDGTTGEGAPILVLGPTQDVVVGAAAVTPKTTNTVDIGSSSLKFKDLWLAGNANFAGTTTLGGALTYGGVTLSNAVTGTGNMVLSASPTLTGTISGANASLSGTLAVTGVATLGNGAILGTPASVTLTNATGLPIATGVSGLGTGVATALAVNVGSAGAPVVNGGALGTPSSGTVTNLTGTASININGTVGATTASTGAFTTLTTSSTVTHNAGTANGVAYLNGSKVLTTGSALTYNGTTLALSGGAISNSNAGLENYILSNGTNSSSLQQNSTSFFFNANNNTASGGQFVWRINSAESEQMRLTSTGLGIGTSSPTSKLHVIGAGQVSGNFFAGFGSANAAIVSSSSVINGGAGFSEFLFGNASTNNRGYLSYSHANDSLLIGTAGATRATLNSSGQLETGIAGSASAPSFTRTGDLNTGIFFPAADTIAFAEGGAESMRIDSAGNVGMGTTSPTAKLTVSNPSVMARFQTGAAADGRIEFAYNTTDIGYINMASASLLDITARSGVSLALGAGGSERMRITSGGDFMVGATSAVGSEKFLVRQTAAAYVGRLANDSATAANCFGQFLWYSSAAPNGTGNQFLRCDDSAATRAEIRSNGGIANYQGNDVNLSDRREKTNFAPAKSYLDTICAIPVQTFNYIDQNMEEDGGLTLGVVAQDVQAVAPELVMESNWGTEENPKQRLSIYQTDLQYALMKALQEAHGLIKDLQARVDALEAK
jgi:hypothetical protein